MHRATKYGALLLYVALFAAANIITARTIPADVGPFLVTWGTWVIGFTFILRDVVQIVFGRAVAYAAIGAALIVSAVTSSMLGDTLAIVAGSTLAIGISEALDTEIFTRFRARIPARIAASGLVAGTVDSVVFAVVALSPLWSGIVPWSALPNVILGQIIVKGALQVVAAGLWRATRGAERLEAAA